MIPFSSPLWLSLLRRLGTLCALATPSSESLNMKAKMEVDPGLREALTDADNGILRPGALPKMPTSSTVGNKQILDALDKACGFTLQDHAFKKKYPINIHIVLSSCPNSSS